MVITEVDKKFNRFRVNRENYVGIAITHPKSSNSVFLKPTEFEFSAETVDKEFFTYAVQPNRTIFSLQKKQLVLVLLDQSTM